MLKNGLKFAFAAAIGAGALLEVYIVSHYGEKYFGPVGFYLGLAIGTGMAREFVEQVYKESASTLTQAQKNLISLGFIAGCAFFLSAEPPKRYQPKTNNPAEETTQSEHYNQNPRVSSLTPVLK